MPRATGGAGWAVAVCATQAGIAAIAAAICAAVWGSSAALAAGYGGLVAVLPTAWFALRALRRQDGEAPMQIVGRFYQGEVGKLALTALLFWFGVSVFAKQFLVLILTYVACLLAYWLVLARVGRNMK